MAPEGGGVLREVRQDPAATCQQRLLFSPQPRILYDKLYCYKDSYTVNSLARGAGCYSIR
eukprot:5429115-Prymnesium_polylepis.1